MTRARRQLAVSGLAAAALAVPAVAATAAADQQGDAPEAELAAANLAAAAFQDVEAAEAAGYVSTLNDLGCFHDAEQGGMGLHYLNQSLMDATADAAAPEELVYELDLNGSITGLVAHEYIVPIEAWTARNPPSLFGRDFHQHPVLPLWVLHTWIWKDNPAGVFQDYNPRVRPCPDGVPIFGEDIPAGTPPTTVS